MTATAESDRAADVRRERIGAFGGRQPVSEIGIKLGAEGPWSLDEGPLHFPLRAEKDGTQNKARDTLGMFLGIRQRQRRAPGTSDQQPSRNAEMVADDFEIVDEMAGRIGGAG